MTRTPPWIGRSCHETHGYTRCSGGPVNHDALRAAHIPPRYHRYRAHEILTVRMSFRRAADGVPTLSEYLRLPSATFGYLRVSSGTLASSRGARCCRIAHLHHPGLPPPAPALTFTWGTAVTSVTAGRRPSWLSRTKRGSRSFLIYSASQRGPQPFGSGPMHASSHLYRCQPTV